MSKSLYVNGPAFVYVGSGSGGALEELGLCVDGVEISPKLFTEDVKVDHYGPQAAFDTQLFLEEASIRGQLVYYDDTVLDKLKSRYLGGLAGVMPPAGTLLLAQNLAIKVVIKSSPDNMGVFGNVSCVKFANCYLQDWKENRSTKVIKVDVTFRALLNQLASGSSGAALYTYSCQ